MLLIGGPIGVLAAIRPRNPLMRLVGIIIAIALATPTFWLGLLFILYFSVSRHWLPASGYVSFVESPVEAATHLLLPALTLGTYGTAVLIRFLSTSIDRLCAGHGLRRGPRPRPGDYARVCHSHA